jgi:hypothetical protein
MAYIAHFLMMHQVTEITSKGRKPSIKPFQEYLRAGKPLNDDIRKWLLALFGSDGYHGVRLVLKSKKGRRRTRSEFEKDIAAYDFYEALCDCPITRQICERYARVLKATPIKFFTTEKRIADGQHEVDRTTYYIQRDNKPNINLVKGKPLPNFVALALTANKYHRSQDALRKTIAQIDRAKQVEI